MSEPEPRVVAEDVRSVLNRAIRPDDPDAGDAVALIAELAATSTRTVYRVLGLESPTLDIGLADRLVLAAGGHLDECRLRLADGRLVEYLDA